VHEFTFDEFIKDQQSVKFERSQAAASNENGRDVLSNDRNRECFEFGCNDKRAQQNRLSQLRNKSIIKSVIKFIQLLLGDVLEVDRLPLDENNNST